jgi:hypothetical protein
MCSSVFVNTAGIKRYTENCAGVAARVDGISEGGSKCR